MVRHQGAQGLKNMAGFSLEYGTLRLTNELAVAEITTLRLEVAFVGQERGVLSPLVSVSWTRSAARKGRDDVPRPGMWIVTH